MAGKSRRRRTVSSVLTRRIKLPATPVHLTCGRDRAHRPVVAMRWPDAAADNQAAREPKPMPVFLWDGHSPKPSPVVDSATGETLSAHTVAVSGSQVDARGGSGVLICAADGRLWACDLARPCFARSPSPMATSLAPAVVLVKHACGGAHALALTSPGGCWRRSEGSCQGSSKRWPDAPTRRLRCGKSP